MKTEAEIKASLQEVFEGLDDVVINPTTVKGQPGLDITLSAMYSAPSYSGKNGLLGIIEAFQKATGYENVDIVDEFAEQGCDTCDWGSSYGKTYRVW